MKKTLIFISAFALAICLTACGVTADATQESQTAEVTPAQPVTLSSREDAKKFVAEDSGFKGFSVPFVRALQGQQSSEEIWNQEIENSIVPFPSEGIVEVKEPYRVAYVTEADDGIHIEGEDIYIVPICKNGIRVASVAILIDGAEAVSGGLDYPNNMNPAVEEYDTFALFHYYPENAETMLYCGVTPEDEVFVINKENVNVSAVTLPDVHFADFPDEYVLHSGYGETILTEADYT